MPDDGSKSTASAPTAPTPPKQGEEPAPGPEDQGRRRRRRLIVAGAVIFVSLLVIADGYLQAYRLANHVEAVYPRLQEVRTALAAGDVSEAGNSAEIFAAVDELTARERGARFTYTLTGFLPFVGRPVDAVDHAVGAASEVTTAARLLLELLREVKGGGGQDSDLVHSGVVDLELLEAILQEADVVRQHLYSARDHISAIPWIPFVGRLGDLQREALVQIDEQIGFADRVLDGLEYLPSFLGKDSPRTYFLALQNNADQRATGGTALAYGIVRADEGRIEMLQAGPIGDLVPQGNPPPELLRKLRVELPASIRWYLAATRRYPLLAQMVNFVPDFPQVASTWSRQVERLTGQAIDGVIAIDPFAVARAMEGQPAITIPAYPEPIDATNVVFVTANDQYRLPVEQQAVLPGQMIQNGFALFTQPSDILALARNLSTALAEKHIQIWSEESAEQDLLSRLGWEGSVRTPPGDHLFLTHNKRVTNKVDYYLRQDIRYRLELDPSGNGTAEVTVTMSSEVPPGEPYAIAGYQHFYGWNPSMLSLYVPARASDAVISPDVPPDFPTRPKDFRIHLEGAAKVFSKVVVAKPGDPAELTFRYRVPAVATEEDGTWTYRLLVQHQALVNPAHLEVSITLPPGMELADADPGWVADGSEVVFSGDLVRDVTTGFRYR